MEQLKDEAVIDDIRRMPTVSAPTILLRAGLKVENVLPQAFSVAQFESLSKDIDEGLSAVRVDYEKRMFEMAEEKAELERKYALLLDWQRHAAGGPPDAQAEHARFVEVARAGGAGIEFLLRLLENGGSAKMADLVCRMGEDYRFLDILVKLGAAEVIRVTEEGVELTSDGHRFIGSLTRLAE